MPLDHYVSQVHLKNFNSPALDGLIYAIRKSDMKRFKTKSQDVCRIEDGSTNAYLKEDRSIEQFLKGVEPHYNTSLVKLRENKVDQQCIHCIAGFVAYVASCSPAAMRIHTAPMKAALESAAAVIDAQGVIPKAPKSLGEKSFTELLGEGTVKFNVDPKYPQAVGIASIMRRVSIFGNSPWEILENREKDIEFFTSDFPVAIQTIDLNTPVNRIVPLAPDIAVRIRPDIGLSRAKPDLTFSRFKSVHCTLKRAEVADINRVIVRCAEELVFFRDDRPWVEGFISNNNRYRIEPVTTTIPHGTGYMNVFTQRVLERKEEPTTLPASKA